MWRRLLNLLTLLSLLLCVASVALWLRTLDQWTDRSVGVCAGGDGGGALEG